MLPWRPVVVGFYSHLAERGLKGRSNMISLRKQKYTGRVFYVEFFRESRPLTSVDPAEHFSLYQRRRTLFRGAMSKPHFYCRISYNAIKIRVDYFLWTYKRSLCIRHRCKLVLGGQTGSKVGEKYGLCVVGQCPRRKAEVGLLWVVTTSRFPL